MKSELTEIRFNKDLSKFGNVIEFGARSVIAIVESNIEKNKASEKEPKKTQKKSKKQTVLKTFERIRNVLKKNSITYNDIRKTIKKIKKKK